MKCAACQRDIADGSNFCPFCGNVQPPIPDAGSSPDPVAPPAPATPGVIYGAPAQPGYSASSSNFGGAPASNKGTIALVLAIASIFLDFFGCCCLGVPSLIGIGLGIAAFVMGRNELQDIAGGFSSADGEGMAKAARVIGVIGAILGVFCFFGVIGMAVLGQMQK